jgi:hypothetical protein
MSRSICASRSALRVFRNRSRVRSADPSRRTPWRARTRPAVALCDWKRRAARRHDRSTNRSTRSGADRVSTLPDLGAGERIRTAGLPFTRRTATCTERASCTDDTGNRTDGTHRAGIVRCAGPRTGPRPRPSCPAILLLCVTLLAELDPNPRAPPLDGLGLRYPRPPAALTCLFGFNPPGVDGQLAALADDLEHDLADLAEILRDEAQAAGRLSQSLGERPEDPRDGVAQAAALAVRRPLATGDYRTARGGDVDAVTRPEIPLRLSDGWELLTECNEQSVVSWLQSALPSMRACEFPVDRGLKVAE